MYDPNYIFALFIALILGFILGFLYRVILYKKDKSRNLAYQGSVLKGKISEQLAPYLHNWPPDLSPADAKFLGSPVDFVVFKGMSEKNISEVVFVEVKSGHSYFNNNESSLEKTIKEKRVRYIPYHVPSEIFNKK